MIRYNFYIKTPILYAKATEIVERLNELIGDTRLGLLVPAIMCIGDNKSSKKIEWYTEDYGPFFWDNWKEDMVKLANEYPDICFVLEGKDSKDWWVGLFQGELSQITHAIPPLYDWKIEQ